MSKRSLSHRFAVLAAGTAFASAIAAQPAAAQSPPGQAGAPADAVAPAVDPANDGAPTGATPRLRGFKGCANAGVCIFRGSGYSIWKVRFGANYAGVWRWILITDGTARRHYSAKNRFANRRLLLRGTRANGTWRTYCLNPGGSRPGPLGPGMLQFKIGAVGSRC
jgi:hypothetical protein